MNCSYCSNILATHAQGARAPWDKILGETPNFVVTPTLGALVEGWLLVISRTHAPAMGSLPVNRLRELGRLLIQVRQQVEMSYGCPTVAFEHGSVCDGTAFGCGVDHAHTHIVPLGTALTPIIERELKRPLEWREIPNFEDLAGFYAQRRPYIYVSEHVGDAGRYTNPQDIPSQLTRRAIANYLGIPRQYDYREHAFEANVTRTCERLGVLELAMNRYSMVS